MQVQQLNVEFWFRLLYNCLHGGCYAGGGLAGLSALATRFAPPHHHGDWSMTNVAIDVAAGLTALSFSFYVVYLLEIVKLTNRRPRRRDAASRAA